MLFRKKTYQISLAAIAFACGSLFATSAVLAQTPPEDQNAGDLVIEFSSVPLFSENDFLPGDSVFGYAKVSNYSGNPKPIAIEAINFVNDNLDTGGKFGDGLRLIIKEDLSSAECFNGTLTEFFNEGEFLLSDPDLLGNGESITYNFFVTFNENSNNDYQGKSLGFDILIGFQGEGGGVSTGGLPPGLTILDQSIRVTAIGEYSATILWTTSYLSTSQVVYAAVGEIYEFDLSEENYGYPDATTEKDNTPPINKIGHGATAHEVTITGLQEKTTYYYRCISHASPPSISRNHSFTTLAMGDGEDAGANGSTQEYGANGETHPNPSPREDGARQEGNSTGANDAGDGVSGEESGLIPSVGNAINSMGSFIDSALGGVNKTEENKEDGAEEDEEGIIYANSGYSTYYSLIILILLLLMVAVIYYLTNIKRKPEKIK